MKKTILFIMVSAAVFILSACSVRGDAADLYKQEAPLEVQAELPGSISAGEKAAFEVLLTQNGKPADQANFVHFEIRKQDGTIPYPMAEAAPLGGGVYRMDARFGSDGLYVLEVHAGSGGSIANPHYQFIVGELSGSELESLKQGPAPDARNSSHHH